MDLLNVNYSWEETEKETIIVNFMKGGGDYHSDEFKACLESFGTSSS